MDLQPTDTCRTTFPFKRSRDAKLTFIERIEKNTVDITKIKETHEHVWIQFLQTLAEMDLTFA